MSKKLALILSIFFSVSIVTFLGFRSGFFEDKYIDLKIKYCSEKQDQKCFTNLVLSVFRKKGLDESLDLVAKIYEKDPSFASTCHDIGHLLGTEAYKLFRVGENFNVSSKAAFCSYGFYHGFMENLAAQGDVKSARDFCRNVDSQISKVTPDASLQCFHGVGHGWVNVHDDKSLWGNEAGIVKKGLTLCEKVAETESELSRCATGVFNGISIFYSTGEYEIKVNKEDPLLICRTQEKKYQDPCYISMNIVLASLSNNDLKKASLYLEPIKDDQVAAHAMLNLAIPVSLASINSTNQSENVEVCRSLQKRLVSPCIQGLAFAFLEHGEPNREYVKSIGFCKDGILTKEESTSCLSYIYSYLAQWYPEGKANGICDEQGDMKDFCYKRLSENKQ